MLSFKEIEIASIWRNKTTSELVIVTSKESRIVGNGGWINYCSYDNGRISYVDDWETFIDDWEEA